MTSLKDGPVRAISAPGKPLIVLTGAAHLMVRGASCLRLRAGATPRHADPRRPRPGPRALGREHATKTRGTLGARIVQRSSINPRKEDSRPSQSGNRGGGGYEIRTREGVNPTRFPSERHRPLGESSAGNLTRAGTGPQLADDPAVVERQEGRRRAPRGRPRRCGRVGRGSSRGGISPNPPRVGRQQG